MIIAVESIESVFAQSPDANHCIYASKCHKCQRDTEIRITKTSGGYGFLGGILYEPYPHVYLILCSDCYEHFGHLTFKAGV